MSDVRLTPDWQSLGNGVEARMTSSRVGPYVVKTVDVRGQTQAPAELGQASMSHRERVIDGWMSNLGNVPTHQDRRAFDYGGWEGDSMTPHVCRVPTHEDQIARDYGEDMGTQAADILRVREKVARDFTAALRKAPTELRPPPEHAGKEFHWLDLKGDCEIFQWHPSSIWFCCGFENGATPKQMAESGYRYLGPAEWRPDDGATVSRGLMQFWKGVAETHAARLSELAKERDERIAVLEAEVARLQGIGSEHPCAGGRVAIAPDCRSGPLSGFGGSSPSPRTNAFPARALAVREPKRGEVG